MWSHVTNHTKAKNPANWPSAFPPKSAAAFSCSAAITSATSGVPSAEESAMNTVTAVPTIW